MSYIATRRKVDHHGHAARGDARKCRTDGPDFAISAALVPPRGAARDGGEQTGTPPMAAARTEQAGGNSGTLQVRLIDAGSLDATANPPAYRRAPRLACLRHDSLWRCRFVVCAGDDRRMVGIYICRTASHFTRTLWLFWCYVWPTTLAVGMVATISRGQRVAVGAAYFAVLSAAGVFGLVRNSDSQRGPTRHLLAADQCATDAAAPRLPCTGACGPSARWAFRVHGVRRNRIPDIAGASWVQATPACARPSRWARCWVGFGATETFLR